MDAIVTDRESDYIFVTDFDTFDEHLDDIINQACRTLSPSTLSPSPAPQPPAGESALQLLDSLLIFRHATLCYRGISYCRCRCPSVKSRYRIQIINGSRGLLIQKFIITIIIIFLNLGKSSRGGRQKLILEIIALMVNHPSGSHQQSSSAAG